MGTKRNWARDALSLGAALLLCAGAALWQAPSAVPEQASLERVATKLLRVQQRPTTVSRNPRGSIVSRTEGSWDVLLELGGEQRWLSVGHLPAVRSSGLSSLSGSSVVVLHDGESVWQVDGPRGSVMSYAERAQSMGSARGSSLTAAGLFGVAGGGLIALGVWLRKRAHAVNAPSRSYA